MSDKDKNNPLVSVGIPTYNRPEGLRRTLECITGQTYKNLEIIVSDNCSSGNETQNIGKEFLEKDSRIKYFRQEENKGMEFNFKFVLEKASGEYFMWAADDDEWAYNFVEVCIKNIGNSSSIFTAFGVLNRKTKSYTICKLPDLSQYFSKYKNIMNFLSIMTSSLIYGIHKRNDIMFILDDVTFDWYDCYFIIKLILNKGFKVINSECLYKAGIDTTTRIMKSKNPSINRVFEYYPFFHSTLKLILKSRDLSIFEKISIIKKLFKFSISSYIYFEKELKPVFTKIASILIYTINFFETFLSNLYKILIIFKRLSSKSRCSYSQCGEDIIIDFIFNALKISNPSYLDIGAHHPTYLSNTYLFYKKNCWGVLVEPDPNLFSLIKKKRKKDLCLNIGIGINDQNEADFYILSSRTLNTFSKEEAERYASYGNQKIENIIKIPLININNIINKYFDSCPNFVSIDVEGVDLEIIKSFNFEQFKPQVFCIETLTFTEDNSEQKIDIISDHMKQFGYIVYADTYINTIYVHGESWKNR